MEGCKVGTDTTETGGTILPARPPIAPDFTALTGTRFPAQSASHPFPARGGIIYSCILCNRWGGERCLLPLCRCSGGEGGGPSVWVAGGSRVICSGGLGLAISCGPLQLRGCGWVEAGCNSRGLIDLSLSLSRLCCCNSTCAASAVCRCAIAPSAA